MNENKNQIASVLFIIGIITMILSFGIGIVVASTVNRLVPGFTLMGALPWWISGFITGMLFIGFAEIIKKIGPRRVPGKLGVSASASRQAASGASAGYTAETETERVFRMLVFRYNERVFHGFVTISSEQVSIFEQNANSLVPLKKKIVDILREDIGGGTYNDTNNGITIQFRDGDRGMDSLDITTFSESQTEELLQIINDLAGQNRMELY